MSFNDNANIGSGRVSRRGRNTGIAVGGGGLLVVGLFLLSQLLGVDLPGLAGGGTGGGQPTTPDDSLSQCDTGSDADANLDCRIKGAAASLETYWSDITLKQKRTFVANTIEDIAEVFGDHEQIKSLGCESVINVPIIVAGDVVGTINCLHDKGFYTEERVKAADALKLPGTVSVMLHEKMREIA